MVQDMPTMETITSKPDHERDFTGCVLSLREYNGYSDSDFFATVWDEEQGCVREIFDGTTRAYAPTKYHKADASPAIIAKALVWYVQNPQVRATAKAGLEAKRGKVSNGDQVVVRAISEVISSSVTGGTFSLVTLPSAVNTLEPSASTRPTRIALRLKAS